MAKSKAEMSRAPSAQLAQKRAVKKQLKTDAKHKAADVEGNFRKQGGYGKPTVSAWAVPPGGIKNSPAYQKLKARCGGKIPPAAERAGAFVSGGFPYSKYPPNVLVDGQRAYWLPDDWTQALKNTGPGGVYVGFMSPKGKYIYHRRVNLSAVERVVGRPLTSLDGFNGVMRNMKAKMEPNVDDRLLKECLTPAERRLLLPANKFHFAIVSARRATSDDGQQSIMIVEAQFRLAGVIPTWYVDADSVADYKNLGLKVLVGGKLTPARNMALDHAEEKGLVCVQVSDDISKWTYYDVEKQNLRGETNFDKANNAVKGSRTYEISPVAAAQMMHAKMRASPLKPRLAGVFPTGNPSMSMGFEEYSHFHFILGDFFVAESSPVRFDTTMTLKEDYDYSCAHIAEHGGVMRCNRMLLAVKHSTNSGGAVSVRDASGEKERYNIAILQKKWPGVFYPNGRRNDEVIMSWKKRNGKTDEDSKISQGKKTAERQANNNIGNMGGKSKTEDKKKRAKHKSEVPNKTKKYQKNVKGKGQKWEN